MIDTGWIVAICGDEGTGKTTFGLTFPRPIRHFDIDVGGYRRASWRLNTEGVESKSYPKPINIEKLKGQANGVSTRAATPKRVEGMRELWQMIVDDFVVACTDPEVRTICIDSATALWNIAHNAHLQGLQENQLAKWKSDSRTRNLPFDESDYRERLQPVEYGPANDRMRTVIHTARSYSKNLVLMHYPTDEYGSVPDGKGGMVDGKTGNKVMDGFKETAKLADIVLWGSIKTVQELSDPSNPRSQKVTKRYPFAKIVKCGIDGMGLDAVGMEIAATYDGLVNLRSMMIGEEVQVDA